MSSELKSFNCQTLDLYTFSNLTLVLNDNKQYFKCSLAEENGDTFISQVWLVGYITSVRVHKKANEGEENATLDIQISDGCHQVRILQFRTSLLEENFQLHQYYSFIVKPFVSLQKSDQNQNQNMAQNQGILVSYHKIENKNEITAHISEFIRTFYYILAPFPSLVVKIIKAYSSNGLAIKEDTLKHHLHLNNNTPDYNEKLVNLNQFINALKEGGFIESNDQGYLMVDQKQ